MCLFDTRPWKLPVPFVGMITRSFIGLIMLANVNTIYERLEILGLSSVYIFMFNICVLATILLLISMFCAQRLRNYFFNPDVKIMCFSFATLWSVVFIFNTGIIMSGFVYCLAPNFQREGEMKYCHFFGNRAMPQIPDWKGAAWPVYYWTSVALTLTMACWQMISWFSWYLTIRKMLQRRGDSTPNGE
ncbi:hypothetical protein ACSS6W_001869 [Trichoderma asperelloides]